MVISDFKKGDEIKKESERIEMEIIENEHDIWLQSTENNGVLHY